MNNRETKIRRRRFLASLQEYTSRRKAVRNFSDRYSDIDSQGRVCIPVDASEGLFSQYGGKRDLNPDLLNYIESAAYYIPIDRPIRICFAHVPGEEQETVTADYRKYFELKFNDKCLDLNICYMKSFGLMALGFTCLFANILLDHFERGFPAVREILTVAASFTMWESVDFFLLERSNVKAEKMDAAQLLLAEIVFQDGTEYNLD